MNAAEPEQSSRAGHAILKAVYCVAAFIAAMLLFGTLGHQPEPYYAKLRWVVSAASVMGIWLSIVTGRPIWACYHAVVVSLFSPIWRVHLSVSSAVGEIIVVAVAALLLASGVVSLRLGWRRGATVLAVLLCFAFAGAPTASLVYGENGTVTVIDAKAATIAATMPMPKGAFPRAIAMHPSGRTLYLGICNPPALWMIYTTSSPPEQTASVPLEACPDALALDRTGGRIYVNDGQHVSVIDTELKTLISRLPFPEDKYADGLAVNPSGTRYYVGVSESILVLDADTPSTTTIPVGQSIGHLAITTDGSTVYASGIPTSSVSVIATATNTVTAHVPLPEDAFLVEDVAIDPAGKKLYLATELSQKRGEIVVVVDIATNTITARIPVTGADAIAVAANGRLMYALSRSEDLVSLIDLDRHAVAGTVPLETGSQPIAVVADPSGSYAYVANTYGLDLDEDDADTE
jgi:DNA-binding beta-propeller fold protein YncE